MLESNLYSSGSSKPDSASLGLSPRYGELEGILISGGLSFFVDIMNLIMVPRTEISHLKPNEGPKSD